MSDLVDKITREFENGEAEHCCNPHCNNNSAQEVKGMLEHKIRPTSIGEQVSAVYKAYNNARSKRVKLNAMIVDSIEVDIPLKYRYGGIYVDTEFVNDSVELVLNIYLPDEHIQIPLHHPYYLLFPTKLSVLIEKYKKATQNNNKIE